MPGEQLAPCRVFHLTENRLVAGTGQPIPPHIPAHLLVYEDPTLAPQPEEPAAEPAPQTTKTGKARTRRKPAGTVENR